MQGEPAEFNVWTREAGPGSLAISVEGPSKVTSLRFDIFLNIRFGQVNQFNTYQR